MVMKKIRMRPVVLAVLIGYTVLNFMLLTLLNHDDNIHHLHRSAGEPAFAMSSAARKVMTPSKVIVEEQDPSALLSCDAYGGPSTEDAAEMVYWRKDDDEGSRKFESIFSSSSSDTDHATAEKYLVFEPDEAGFNNVRMSFETVFALAKATGRILVLPPKCRFSQLAAGYPNLTSYYYTDFFDISSAGSIPTISFQNYLERMQGRLRDNKGTGDVAVPPERRTNWDGRIGNAQNANKEDADQLWKWVEQTMPSIKWKRDLCIVAFPATTANNSTTNSTDDAVKQALDWILKDDKDHRRRFSARIAEYNDNPTPVNASTVLRLREMLAQRRQLCYYHGTPLEQAESIFMTGHEDTGSRLLIPFYAYLFFEDWRHDVLMKRFVRDHVRFADVIQCAAARIVHAIREGIRQQQSGNTNTDASFDTMHVRRSDFMSLPTYSDGMIPAEEMNFFETNRTVYIATDERNKSFFEAMRKKYNVFFLEDFSHLIKDVDPNFYGMIEQLVCTRGTKFVGTFYSTFSAYINRIRGYHSQKSRLPGYERGIIDSEYMGHRGIHRAEMFKYVSLQNQFWIREWPVAWRDIDHLTE